MTYHDLAIPTGDYNTQINCPYTQRLSGFEVYGFPVEVQFHGVINLQEGYLKIEGVLKSLDPSQTAQIPVEIRKSFEAAPLLPARTCYSLVEAKQVNPLEVYELFIKPTNLEYFPAAILEYKNLESFWMVGSSQFKEFPTAFYELKSLHTIRLYHTAIAELLPAIQQFY